ncbi:MAG TPA: ABC transporter substrate binding protein [Gammaproteobacteria bacterium]
MPSAQHRRAAGAVRARRNVWLGWLLLLLGGLPASLTAAEPARVQVLLSETGGAYGELLEALQERLDIEAPGRIDLQSQLVPEAIGDRRELFASRPALIVSVGIRASALALQDADDLPVLSLLVPYDSYTSLLENAAAQSGHRLPHSAIYLDQPLARQLALLQLVLPKARRIAALAGPHSAQRAGELGALCLQRGLKLTTETVGATDNPVPVLSQLLERAEVLLALPDPAVFNRNNLQAILLTTYRSGVPVVGFSQAYVRAGALAAVHSTAGQIGTQAGEWIAELANGGRWQLGTPRYPGYYSVAVNAQVAQTLGINVADEHTLLERLRALEEQRDGLRP